MLFVRSEDITADVLSSTSRRQDATMTISPKLTGMSRRDFVEGAAAGLALLTLGPHTVKGEQSRDAALRSDSQVSVTRTGTDWKLDNGHIHIELSRSGHRVQVKSMRLERGGEWAVGNASVVASPEKNGQEYGYFEDAISDLPKGGKQLTLRFKSAAGGLLSLMLKLYPTDAMLEISTQIENRGQQNLLLDAHINPLCLTLKNPPNGLQPYSSVEGQHGFKAAGSLSTDRHFDDWVVLENPDAGESVLIGGEPGLGILGWEATTHTASAGTVLRAGTILAKGQKGAPPPIFELAPGKTVETPISFLAIAKGDPDNAGNEAFRFLKRYVFLTPLPNAPWATYCVWLTVDNAEELLLEELKLAKQVGFDVFYHDATWFKDSSVIPGMNDWTKGLGNYEDNLEKFPHGMKSFTDAIHAEGLKTGVWVDPANVDASLVESGKIPREWLAMIDGKENGTIDPSLTPTKQLCMGNPEVVAWIEKQLSGVIEKWHLDWLKWDPSATQSYECNRTDHGHGKTDGAYAAYRGRSEILRYLLERFPELAGFECDPSLHYARTNPGPQRLLPGGYTNDFITGPMVSPNVWGSFFSVEKSDDNKDSFAESWYSASALDYYFRKHLTHGPTFGNINGMESQMLSHAPAGFIEAFQRNLLYFKQYRHLLYEDVYHPKLKAAGWSSIQYVPVDPSESVVFVFRDHSAIGSSTVELRGLEPTAKYRVTSLNDRPGRDRVITGDDLMKGISVTLPDKWLARGNGIDHEFADQLNYGSDILLLARL